MAGSLKWNGPEAQRRIRGAVLVLLRASAILVQNRAKELLSKSGTGTKKVRSAATNADGSLKTRRLKGGDEAVVYRTRTVKVYGANPSAPGEPPAKQTGRGRASVSIEVDEATLTARVGTNVKYMKWLELGTRFIKARPWLRRALAECQPAIRALFARGKGV